MKDVTVTTADSTENRLQTTIEVGKAIKEIITEQGLWMDISGKPYVMVEGWNALYTILGLTPRIIKLDFVQGGWLAHGELVNPRGEVVAQAFGFCGTKNESKMFMDGRATVSAQVSMAQTRCVGKLGRTIAGHIMKLAGYQATPAEEMMGVGKETPRDERLDHEVVEPPED